MHQQVLTFTIVRSARTVFMFCIYLRANNDLCPLYHKLIDFYNRVEKCLQRGTDWDFKLNSLPFVCKGLIFCYYLNFLYHFFHLLGMEMNKAEGNWVAVQLSTGA
jgi:hypothetical protein